MDNQEINLDSYESTDDILIFKNETFLMSINRSYPIYRRNGKISDVIIRIETESDTKEFELLDLKQTDEELYLTIK